MADAIETINGKEAFVSLKQDAWHHKGNVVQSLTKKEFLPAAGLDNWNVEKQPMILSVNGEDVPVADKYVTVRGLDNKVLGTNLGSQYEVFQVEEMLALAEAVAGEGAEIQPETGGSINDGRRVFLTFSLPESLWTLADDKHIPYFALLNSFDASLALTPLATLVRIVCANTANLALSAAYAREADAKAAGKVDTGVYRITHRSQMRTKVEEVRKALGLSQAYFAKYQTFADEAMHARLGTREFDVLLDAIFPVGETVAARANTTRGTARDAIRNLYENSAEVGKFSGTRWGAIQAVSTYEQWEAPIKPGNRDAADVRAERQIDAAASGGFPLTEKAKTHLLTV